MWFSNSTASAASGREIKRFDFRIQEKHFFENSQTVKRLRTKEKGIYERLFLVGGTSLAWSLPDLAASL
jgi:hypothetical protein